MPGRAVRSEFSKNEDILLTKFIATYNPGKQGRGGNTLYQRLVENVDGKWNWSETHSWQSWRNRYAKNSQEFDMKILKYQRKKGIDPGATAKKNKSVSPPEEEVTRVRSKRAGDRIISQQREAKRAKLETNQPGGERSRLSPVEAESAGPPESSRRVSSPLHTQEQAEAVSNLPPPIQEPKGKFNIPPLPARSDTLPLPSSPFKGQPPATSQLPPSSQPLVSSSQRVATPKPPSSHKLVLKPKSVSPFFRSLSPTPDHSTPPKKTLPKVEEGHFTTSLTDRFGHVRPGYQSESEEERELWPPVRGKKGKEKDVVSGPNVVSSSAIQQHEHHPISRVETAISQPALVLPKREPKDQQALAPNHPGPDHHPFSQVSLPSPPHNRTGMDIVESPLKHRSTNGVRQLVQNLRNRKLGAVTDPSTSKLTPAYPLAQPTAGHSNLTSAAIHSGSTSTIELPPGRAVVAPAAPSLDGGNTSTSLAQISGWHPTLTTNAHPAVSPPERDSHSGVPAGRSNIQSLSGPSPLSVYSNGKGKTKRRDTDLPLTHAQRLLTRARKQRRRETLGGYRYDGVPNIDLTRAHSAASTSRIPYSKHGTSTPVSRLLHRHSLPAHFTPSAVHADLSGYLTTQEQPGTTIPPVSPALITPADVPLSASIGFSTLISRIATAHGYMPSVVLEVYKRLGSLKEVEGFVRAMRNAAEGWVEAEFERREREARRTSRRQDKSDSSEDSESNDDAPRGRPSFNTVEHRTPNGLHLRYVPPPDASDYEPPPTSRAARWKQASMSGVGSASWGTIDTERYRTTKPEITEHMMEGEDAVNSSEGDHNASAEDEETQDDLERAEEETVAEELIPGSSQEGLQEEDILTPNQEQGADEEPELAYEEHSDQDGHLDPNYRVTHAKSESPISPGLHRTPGHSPVPNGVEITNSDSPGVRLTRSVPRSWNADEDRALLSAHWEALEALERQWGKGGMRQRVVQLLR